MPKRCVQSRQREGLSNSILAEAKRIGATEAESASERDMMGSEVEITDGEVEIMDGEVDIMDA